MSWGVLKSCQENCAHVEYGGERGEDIQDTPEGCPKMLTQLEIHRKDIHVNRNPQISIEPQKKKAFTCSA